MHFLSGNKMKSRPGTFIFAAAFIFMPFEVWSQTGQTCELFIDNFDLDIVQFSNRKLNYAQQYNIDFPGESVVARGMAFNTYGTRLYLALDNNTTDDDVIYEYDLASPWDLSPGGWSYLRQKKILDSDLGLASVEIRAIAFSKDGSKLYVLETVGARVYQFSLSSAWNITTASYAPDNINFDYTNELQFQAFGLTFSEDGKFMYISAGTSDVIQQYSLSDAWDVSTASPLSSYDFTEGTGTKIVRFNDGGSKMYILATTDNIIFEYSLGTDWRIDTAGDSPNIGALVDNPDTDPVYFDFRDGGGFLYVSGNNDDYIVQYRIGRALLLCPEGVTRPPPQVPDPGPPYDPDQKRSWPLPPGDPLYPWPGPVPERPGLQPLPWRSL